ncbi:MAG: hypothetical protein AAF960_28000 [Bacteroidota bacterium]
MRILPFLLSLFFLSCNAQIKQQANVKNTPSLTIEELLVELPDEAFYIKTYGYEHTISREERQIILQTVTQEMANILSADFKLDTSKGGDSFLAFSSRGDEGIYVVLKTWQKRDKSLIVGVNISVGDHCCDYSTLQLFHCKNQQFKEVTDQLFPKLTLEDFVPNIDNKTKALVSTPLQISVWAFPENDSLRVANYNTPAMFDLDYAHDLGDELDFRELTLVWEKDRFVISARKPLGF